MDDLKATRMTSLENWRVKAFSLGGPLGHVLSKSFDLVQTVVRDGVLTDQAETSLGYSIESLARERELALVRDVDRYDPLHALMYGLTESIGTMVESILEEKQQMRERSQAEWHRASTDTTLPLIEYPPLKDEDIDDLNDPWMNPPGDDKPCTSTQAQSAFLNDDAQDPAANMEEAPCSSGQSARTADALDAQTAVASQPVASVTASSDDKAQKKAASSDPQAAKNNRRKTGDLRTSLVGWYNDDFVDDSEEEDGEAEEDEDWHPRGDEAAADAAKSVAARRKRRADRAERQFIVGSDVEEEDDDWQPEGDDADVTAPGAAKRSRQVVRADKQRNSAGDIAALHLRERCRICHKSFAHLAVHMAECHETGRRRPTRSCKSTGGYKNEDVEEDDEEIRPNDTIAKSRPKRLRSSNETYKEEDGEDDDEKEESRSNDNIAKNRPKRRCTKTEMSKKGDEKDDHEEEHVKEDVPCSSTSKPAGADALHCDKCDRTFHSAQGLKIHTNWHREQSEEKAVDKPEDEPEGSATLRCDKCDRTFESSRGLNIHANWCRGKAEEQEADEPEGKPKEKTPADEACPFQKTEVKARITVTDGQSPATPRPFGCPHCPLDRLSLPMLNHHLRTYHDLKPYECTICAEKFARKRELREHREKEGHQKPIVVD